MARGIYYASDEHGEYLFFTGEAVSSFADVPPDLQQLIIPAARYQKFTAEVGGMPAVLIDAWQQIWQMTENDFVGKRAYIADFELYDQCAANPAEASLDNYMGLEN